MRVSTIHKFVVLYLLSFLAIFQRWNYCNNNFDLLPGRRFSKFRKWSNSKGNYPTWNADFEWTIRYNYGSIFDNRTRIRRRSTRFGFLQILRYSFKTLDRSDSLKSMKYDFYIGHAIRYYEILLVVVIIYFRRK